MDVLVVGSLNVDEVVRVARLPTPGQTVQAHSMHRFPGGKGLNQAIAAARSGSSVAMVGAVGDDRAGGLLRAELAAAGIDHSRVDVLAETQTGTAVIAVDDTAENFIVVTTGANSMLRPRLDDLPAARVVLGQLETRAEVVAEVFARSRAAGAITVLNPAPAGHLTGGLLAVCDVLIPNEHEVADLGGAKSLLDAGVATLVVTRGAAGCTVITDERVTHVAPYEVFAVDTTAAGDAFCGSFASRLADGATVDEAVIHASAAGALATTSAGAAPSIPTRAQIDELRHAQPHPTRKVRDVASPPNSSVVARHQFLRKESDAQRY